MTQNVENKKTAYQKWSTFWGIISTLFIVVLLFTSIVGYLLHSPGLGIIASIISCIGICVLFTVYIIGLFLYFRNKNNKIISKQVFGQVVYEYIYPLFWLLASFLSIDTVNIAIVIILPQLPSILQMFISVFKKPENCISNNAYLICSKIGSLLGILYLSLYVMHSYIMLDYIHTPLVIMYIIGLVLYFKNQESRDLANKSLWVIFYEIVLPIAIILLFIFNFTKLFLSNHFSITQNLFFLLKSLLYKLPIITLFGLSIKKYLTKKGQ